MRNLAWSSPLLLVAALVLFGAAGCNNNTQSAACTVGTATGCMAGQTCERVGTSSACFAPLLVKGRILDALDMHPIAGARVLALDANGAAVSTVVTSGMDGTYTLPVPAERTSSGTPVMAAITLRVDAASYQTFPTAPRTALPIDLSTAATVDGAPVVMSSATDVLLLPRSGGSGITLAGNVVGQSPGGVLVVAEQGGHAVASAISDTAGSFELFDVPAGMTHVAGYRAGLRITPLDVTAAAPGTDGLVLDAQTGGLGTVTGSINIVNAPGASSTSVILVVESTFVASAARGEAPAGLRAGNVTSMFSIPDVPPGAYVVLAAFENDGLVRDPDTSIAGTAIQHITVPDGGGPVDIAQSFKVTGALAVVSPGASTVDVVTTAMPVLSWADDSSEDGYELRVFDAFGNMVFENTMIPSHTGAGSVDYTYDGPALTSGMLYQFRVVSWRTGHGGAPRTYISATEDLRGVFVYKP
jgi:hypothetical protein